MAPGTSERQVYRSFWNKFSGRADNTSMLLNANADELAELDRAEIIGMLPPFGDQFVVDIGAGIGRFTSVFAKEARKVLSTDFMDSFIAKNRERNDHWGNVDFRVGDALGLELEEGSVDLVFTNWLLMYLSDEEVVRFLCNVIGWLRPGGHLHLRESCSEPSTVTKGVSLHSQKETNPTRYRFSSAYLQLLRAIRFVDEAGMAWRFEVHWACSVGVYIEENGNWRQIHWLVSKVPAGEEGIGIPASMEVDLSNKLTREWPEEQRRWDKQLEGAEPTHKMLTEKLLTAIRPVEPGSVLFTFNGHGNGHEIDICPHILAKHFDCHLWSVHTSPWHYRHSLTVANTEKDRRVRMAWHPELVAALAFLEAKNSSGEEKAEPSSSSFSAFLGIDLLAQIEGPEEVAKIAALLPSGGQLAIIETGKVDGQKMQLLGQHFVMESREAVEMDNGQLGELVVARKGAKAGEAGTGEWPLKDGF